MTFRCIRVISSIHYSRQICMGFTMPSRRRSFENAHTDLPLILLYLSLKPQSNGHNISHNILTTFVVTYCDHARANGHNNLSTLQEQNGNVVTMLRQSLNEFKGVTTCHNTSQHCWEGWSNGLDIGSQQMLWECCDVWSGLYISPLNTDTRPVNTDTLLWPRTLQS